MNTGRRTLLFLALSAGLLVPALVTGALMQSTRPDCVTCGANVAFTLWVIFVAALHPPIWSGDASRKKRSVAWFAGATAGVVIYLVTEAIAGLLLLQNLAAAASIGFVANMLGAWVAYASSRATMRRPFRGAELLSAASVDPSTESASRPIARSANFLRRQLTYKVAAAFIVIVSTLCVAVWLFVRGTEQRESASERAREYELWRQKEIARRLVSLKLLAASPRGNPSELQVRICNKRTDSIGSLSFVGSTFRSGRSTVHSVKADGDGSFHTDRIVAPNECVVEPFQGRFVVMDSVKFHVTCALRYAGQLEATPGSEIDRWLARLGSCRENSP